MTRQFVYIFGTILLLQCHLTVFGQQRLTLKQAVAKALEHNYSIVIAQNEALISKTNNTAGNAGFLPEVALNVGQNYNINNTKQEFFSGDVRQGSGVNSNTANANLLASWTFFDGMRMFINRDRLRELESMGKLNLQLQIENTISQAMMAYHNIQQQKRRKETIEKAIEISSERLALAKVKNRIGSGNGLDVLQAEVDINADSTALIRQLLTLKTAMSQLNEIMGEDPSNVFETVTEDVNTRDFDYQDIVAKAESRNTMIQMADKSIAIGALTIKQFESIRYPTFDLNLGYNFSRFQTEIGVLKFNQNAGLSFGLTGRWNIFNGWNNKREIQVAKLQLESNKLMKTQSILNIKTAILDAYNTHLTTKELVKMEEKNINIAQKNLDITSDKMRIGTINAIELRQAQLNLVDANFRKIIASFEAKIAEIELLRLSGQLVDMH